MKKENVLQANLKNQEVSKMSTANVPYNNQQLLKWSCFTIQEPANIWLREKNGVIKTLSDWEIDKMSQHPKQSWKGLRNFESTKTPLIELANKPGYEQFRDKLNWLYNNYSKENYQLVWNELQSYNEHRKTQCIQKTIIARAEYFLNKQIEEYKAHFGPMPKWVDKLTDNQRAYLLDRAKTCYGLVPEEIVLQTKQVYIIPERIIKELSDEGITYYSQEELSNTSVKDKVKRNCYNEVVGKVKVYSRILQRLAENAVLRDARWMAQFNNTEFDLREHREVEGDENGNKMVPITDLQGPDSPYGLDVEFRDFLEPIYAEDEGR